MKLQIENLSFGYSDKKILNGINLIVKSGESIGIAGISGGGKSTLLKLISGLYSVQEGRIIIGSEESPLKRRALVSMVMQNAMLFPASIRDNITCGHKISEETVRNACEAAQLTEWISGLPD
ncbi:MAG: ABC transporter ATP-binding protein/permease, partial [Treponema sp.]|nr:ABC transporter ATP-binding protein/permease [Treponema sp.]